MMEEGNGGGGGSADVGYDLNNDFERANGKGAFKYDVCMGWGSS